jgi:branched-chain amino acid transport system substrate-binding protein
MQRTSSLWRTLATGSFLAVVVTSLALAGCGSGSASVNKALKIGTDLPVSGGDASATLPAQYGVDLAISQASLPDGYTVTVVHKDDEGASGPDGSIGAANITALQNDSTVIGVIGPFNSGVAKQEIPIVNAGGGPTLISPTNTNPGLTLQQYAQEAGVNFDQLHPSGKPDFYFRLPANDFLQGKADAQIALSAPQIMAKTAFVVDDTTTYGKPLADFFTSFFTQGGGTIVGNRAEITPNSLSSLPQLAATIKAAKPDVVFYGGITSQGGCKLKKALVGAGYTKAMVGGDGIADDPGCLSDAGAASVGLVGTIAAPDPSTLTSSAATTLQSAYTTFVAGKPNNTFTPYSAQSYDAANVMLQAIKNVINAGQTVNRINVRNAVANIHYTGVIGSISFDSNGDNAGLHIFSVYAVLPGTTTWKYQTEITF